MTESASAELARVQRLARLLDSAVGIPGTKIRIGLDSVIGLVPGLGDVAGSALSGYIVLTAARMGAPASLLARMLANVAVDTATGVVPVVGDLVDVAWRANSRNVALLEQHLLGRAPGNARPPRASRGALAAIVGAMVLLAACGIALAVLLVRFLGHLLG